jgi:hypothetical protein
MAMDVPNAARADAHPRPLTLAPAPVEAPPRAIELRVDPRAVTRVLVGVVTALTALSIAAQVARFGLGIPNAYGLVPLVDAIGEHNVPTFYSSVALLLAAVLAGALALAASGRSVRGWTTLGVLFFLAAMDEFITFHELVDEWMKRLVDTGGVLHWAWVLPGGAFALAVLVALRSFVRSLDRPIRVRLVAGAALFLGGALGIELAEGAVLSADGGFSLTWGLVCTSQETLEMLGVVVWIEALLLALLPLRFFAQRG